LISDVGEQGSIDAAAKTVDQAVGDEGLSALVNSARVAISGPLEYLPVDDLRRQKIAKMADRTGISPEKVARAVDHALTARHSKTRLIVGLDA
jgi:hypothetical protein